MRKTIALPLALLCVLSAYGQGDPSRYVVQPEIDWGRTASRDLLMFVTGTSDGTNLYDSVKRRYLTRNGAFSPGLAGGVALDGSTTRYQLSGALNRGSGLGWTVCAIIVNRDMASATREILNDTTSGIGGINLRSGSNSWQFASSDNGGTLAAFDQSTGPGTADATPALFCGVHNGVDLKRIYFNGVPRGNTAVGATPVAQTGATIVIGSHGASGDFFNGVIFYVAIWGREFTDMEMKELYLNPYEPVEEGGLLPLITSARRRQGTVAGIKGFPSVGGGQ